jgi:hypothetical protein
VTVCTPIGNELGIVGALGSANYSIGGIVPLFWIGVEISFNC